MVGDDQWIPFWNKDIPSIETLIEDDVVGKARIAEIFVTDPLSVLPSHRLGESRLASAAQIDCLDQPTVARDRNLRQWDKWMARAIPL